MLYRCQKISTIFISVIVYIPWHKSMRRIKNYFHTLFPFWMLLLQLSQDNKKIRDNSIVGESWGVIYSIQDAQLWPNMHTSTSIKQFLIGQLTQRCRQKSTKLHVTGECTDSDTENVGGKNHSKDSATSFTHMKTPSTTTDNITTRSIWGLSALWRVLNQYIAGSKMNFRPWLFLSLGIQILETVWGFKPANLLSPADFLNL